MQNSHDPNFTIIIFFKISQLKRFLLRSDCAHGLFLESLGTTLMLCTGTVLPSCVHLIKPDWTRLNKLYLTIDKTTHPESEIQNLLPLSSASPLVILDFPLEKLNYLQQAVNEIRFTI